jgi:hypothetical protein
MFEKKPTDQPPIKGTLPLVFITYSLGAPLGGPKKDNALISQDKKEDSKTAPVKENPFKK